jgi:N-acetylglucosamine-6-sulfatase
VSFDHTVFVFTSDNGYSFGSHQWRGKLAPYDEETRVPLAIAGPGIAHGVADAMAASLVPLLDGKRPRWRKDLLIEYRAPPNYPFHTLADVRRTDAPNLVPDYISLRTTAWQYTEWYAGSDHEYELYDMKKDPYQLTNLVADPSSAARYGPVMRDLQARLDVLAACSGASCR